MQIDKISSYYVFSDACQKQVYTLCNSCRLEDGFLLRIHNVFTVRATILILRKIGSLRYSMVKALNLSEAARIALLQEMMRDAKRNERGGLLTCLIAVVVSVAGFSTTSLAGNSVKLGVVGLVIAAVGFAVYFYYAHLYSRLVGQLAKIAFKSAVQCPQCGKELPEGEFGFCPFCGSSLKSEGGLQQEFLDKNTPPLS